MHDVDTKDVKSSDELFRSNGKGEKEAVETQKHLPAFDSNHNKGSKSHEKHTDNTIKVSTKSGLEQVDSNGKVPNVQPLNDAKHHGRQGNFSDEVLSEHTKRIVTAWPSTTLHARETFPEFCAMYECIKEHGMPNFLGAKIPVKSDLVIPKWEEHLKSYHDKDLVLFLKYGWPVGYHSDNPPSSVKENHPSAKNHLKHVNSFVQKEIQHKAILGPFKELPFAPWCRLSPLMTRPKKELDEHRIIMYLSFPHGCSPNDGIDIYNHLGKDISYSLPSISDLITKLQIQGPGSWIWKADLSRAYRQIRIDPLDTLLLGFCVEDLFYIDLCPSFGCKSSSAACQRIANAVSYLMAQKHVILGYLDDYAGSHSYHLQSLQGYTDFKALMQELGLKLAPHKCLPPSQRIEWLGFEVDTVKMTISIPARKMKEIVGECQKWTFRKRANRTMIQSILGKLIYISACINQGRKFVARMLDTLRAMGERNWTSIDKEFRKDIEWFQRYGDASNGIHLYKVPRTAIVMECDSSKTGAGGNSGQFCYSWRYDTQHVQRFSAIHQLEAVNIIVAFRTLAHLHDVQSAQVIIMTDNAASSYALETGKTRDPVLAACSRELWLEAAKSDHHIVIQHKPGVELVLADALSRRHSDKKKKADLADSIIHRDSLEIVSPVINNYVFFNTDL